MTIPESYCHIVGTDSGVPYVVSALRAQGGVASKVSVAATDERFASRWVGGAATSASLPVLAHSFRGA